MLGARTVNAAPTALGVPLRDDRVGVVAVGVVGFALVAGMPVGTVAELVPGDDVWDVATPFDGAGAAVMVEIGVQAVISSLISAAWDLPAGCTGTVAVGVPAGAPGVAVDPLPVGVDGRVPVVGRLPDCFVPPVPAPDVLLDIPVSSRSIVCWPVTTFCCAAVTAATRAVVL